MKDWTGKILGRGFYPHSLRHSRASQMARAGKTMKFTADYLGITVDTASRIYSHLRTEDLAEAPPAMGGS
ncbi:hypothetical protein AKJ65_03215 [candidate division MSBL1 archaeon SCGC-AAA259E19]|uniref:Tyr recombinase domain-containing protein n=1 Tax=candidate division MSBL1 archaeon SCGC-AAA259E19 TaxID=1698264 RepID=A0A133UL47_9EURY|nr:hypothetical protein AKJ65_03215 [candidate division MSBL1 archaeon SCGC-AAA259E19]